MIWHQFIPFIKTQVREVVIKMIFVGQCVSISQIFFLISGHEIIYKIIACHHWIVELYSFIAFIEIFTLNVACILSGEHLSFNELGLKVELGTKSISKIAARHMLGHIQINNVSGLPDSCFKI